MIEATGVANTRPVPQGKLHERCLPGAVEWPGGGFGRLWQPCLGLRTLVEPIVEVVAWTVCQCMRAAETCSHSIVDRSRFHTSLARPSRRPCPPSIRTLPGSNGGCSHTPPNMGHEAGCEPVWVSACVGFASLVKTPRHHVLTSTAHKWKTSQTLMLGDIQAVTYQYGVNK